MIQDEHIQTLIGLRLTLLQAKIYLNLAKLEKADVKTLSKASNVARQDIYRIMPTLQKLGLTEKIIAKPTMYRATPIKEGLSILLQNRKTEIAELQKKTSSLIETFQAKNTKIDPKDETHFVITSEITRFLKIHRKQAQKVQERVDIMIPVITFPSKVYEDCIHLKGPLKRGVKVRLIAPDPAKETTQPPWQVLAKNPLFEIKYLASPPNFGMHIFDRKEVTLQVSAKGILPSLWTNNPTVVELASSYFNCMWGNKQ